MSSEQVADSEAPAEEAPPAAEEAPPAAEEAPPPAEEAPPPAEEAPPPAEEAPPSAEEAPAVEEVASAAEEAPAQEDASGDAPDPKMSSASIKKTVSLPSTSPEIPTSSTPNVTPSQVKVSGSVSRVSSKATPGSQVGLSASRTAAASKSVLGSRVTLSSSKAGGPPESRLALLSSSKISLSRTGLSPSVMQAQSKTATSGSAMFQSQMALDRSGSRADRQKSLDQRVNLARQALSGSTMSIRHIDYEAEKNKVARYMNTYRMESKYPFCPFKVERILEEVLNTALSEVHYEPRQAAKMSMALSSEIRGRVKSFQFERYKIVVIVDIGEKQAQSLYSAFRFLWDVEKDSYAMAKYENVTLFAVAVCYGVYRE